MVVKNILSLPRSSVALRPINSIHKKEAKHFLLKKRKLKHKYNPQRLCFSFFIINFGECLKLPIQSSLNLTQVFVVVAIAVFVVFLSTLCLCLLTLMFTYDFFQISCLNTLVPPASQR